MATTVRAYDVAVAQIGIDAVPKSIKAGWQDFLARPTTAIFVIVIYPLVGVLLYRFTFDQALLPLLFPIASGFALVGPLAATGVYEISRRREHGQQVEDGVGAYAALDGERLVPLVQVGLLLLVIYAAWIGTAQLIYDATLGGFAPTGLGALAARVFTTPEGLLLLVAGCGTGFVMALVVLAVGAVSLPAIVDKGLGAADAVALSVRAFTQNMTVMLVWGLAVAAALVLGTLPFFLGLVIVLPVFGHATWHLYRHLVPSAAAA